MRSIKNTFSEHVKDAIVGRPIRLNRRELVFIKNDYAEVVFIGDVHLGSPQCDKQRFLSMRDYCLKKKVYVLLMGDLIEAATRNSVGAGVYEQITPAQQQCEEIVEYISPLAKKELVLGLHSGNHEDRVWRESGINVSKFLARELGVPYLGPACWSEFRVGGQRYRTYTLHGRTAARYDGTALQAVERIANSFDADLVAHAHAHKCVDGWQLTQYVENGLVKEHKKLIMITGSYLKYDGSYHQEGGGQIPKLGSPKVKFFADKHDLHISW